LHDWWTSRYAGHLTIGDNVRIQAQSGVGRNIKDNEVLQGSPAFGYNDYSKSYVHFRTFQNLLLK
jgi:UDP-3-O-[3-hydroxymyristoyl] glucosamine N-acyltransferase